MLMGGGGGPGGLGVGPEVGTPPLELEIYIVRFQKKLANIGKYILPWYVQIVQCTHLCNPTSQHIRIGGGSQF